MMKKERMRGGRSGTLTVFVVSAAFIWACLLMAPGVAIGEETEENTITLQLGEIVVEADAVERSEEVQDMTVVKPELLPKNLGTSLDTALERQAGVDVQRIQEVGTAVDDDSIRIRGFGARRIVAAVDGRIMNTSGVAGGYFIDWTMVPLINVDRLEIIKGIGDPRFGNVLGGVVNLVKKKPPREHAETTLQASAASFDSRAANLYHAWTIGNLEYSFGFSHSESDGYLRNSSYNYNGGELYLGYTLPNYDKVTLDVTRSELHKGFIVANRATSTFEAAGYDTPLDPAYPASDGEFLYGGSAKMAKPRDGSWWEKQRWLLDFGFERIINDTSDMQLNYWTRTGKRETYNVNQDGTVFHKIYDDDRSYGFTGEYNLSLDAHEITAGFDINYLGDEGSETAAGDSRGYQEWDYYVAARNESFFVMDDIEMNERLTLTPAVRYMSYNGRSGPESLPPNDQVPHISMKGVAPSLKIAYDFNENSLGYLSVARALRMPTPPEHYWHYSQWAGVDTSAFPFNEEDGLMLQGGLKYENKDRGLKIDFSPYYYVIDDYIQFDLLNFIAYNIEEAKLYGVEFEVSKRFSPEWSSFANYTYQKSSTSGDPFVTNFMSAVDSGFDEVPGLPEHKINIGLQYRTPCGGRLALFATYVSDQDVLYSNNTIYPSTSDLRIRSQDSYTRLDFEGSMPFRDMYEIGFFVRNIADEDYDERLGFPAAERNYGISLSIDF